MGAHRTLCTRGPKSRLFSTTFLQYGRGHVAIAFVLTKVGWDSLFYITCPRWCMFFDRCKVMQALEVDEEDDEPSLW